MIKKIIGLGSSLIGGVVLAFLSLVVVAAFTGPSSAPATESGAIAVSGGNVGMGTASPDYNLDVEGSSPSIRINGTDANGFSRLFLTTLDRDWRIVNDPSDKLFIYDGTVTATRLAIDTNGNVGIGTTTPGAYRLNVNGNTNITGDLNIAGTCTGCGGGGQFTEAFSGISSPPNSTWTDRDLSSLLPSGANTAFVKIYEASGNNGATIGVRENGSSLLRTFQIEDTSIVVPVSVSSSSIIEIYQCCSAGTEFTYVGATAAGGGGSEPLVAVGEENSVTNTQHSSMTTINTYTPSVGKIWIVKDVLASANGSAYCCSGEIDAIVTLTFEDGTMQDIQADGFNATSQSAADDTHLETSTARITYGGTEGNAFLTQIDPTNHIIQGKRVNKVEFKRLSAVAGGTTTWRFSGIEVPL